MNLGAPHHDALGLFLHHPQVGIRVGLHRVRRPQHAVPLDAGNPGAGGQVFFLQDFAVVFDAVDVVLVADDVGGDVDGVQGVGADVVGQGDIPVTQFGGLDDQVVGPNQILGILGLVVVAADGLAGIWILHDGHVASGWVFGHLIIDGHQVDANGQIRVGGDVLHPFPLVKDDPPIV